MKKCFALTLVAMLIFSLTSCRLSLLPLDILSVLTEQIDDESKSAVDTDRETESAEEVSDSESESVEDVSETESEVVTESEDVTESETETDTEPECFESETEIDTELESDIDSGTEDEEDTESEAQTEEKREPITIETIKGIVGVGAESFAVGEDRYDIDCTAYRLTKVTLNEYSRILYALVDENMKLYADNGISGIDGVCFQSTLYDEAYTVNLTFYSRTGELYLTVEAYRSLSEYQIAPSSIVGGTKTTFHMPEMPTVYGEYKFGECEIFQLSNGHFVIVDGAQEFSAAPTVEYLESLTLDGVMPVVDAWFLTHAHPDHAYCVWGIGIDSDLVGRIVVEGFYYTLPDDEGMRKEPDYDDLMIQISNVREALGNFKNSRGETTPQYKLHGGMRFYFSELEVQVLFTQDQIRPDEYGNKLNDTSTSFKFIVHTEAKNDTTFLIMGDASEAICKKLMKMYEADTLHTTYFQSLHHGNNDCIEFFRYIQPEYLNYTHKSDEKGRNKMGYKYLALTCKGVNYSPTVIEIK